MKRLALLLTLILSASGLLALQGPPASAAGESWTVTGVNSFGCEDGDISLDVAITGLGGMPYVFHTRAIVDGKLYMNEGFLDTNDGPTSWGIYSDDSYDIGTPLTGVYPMPAGKPITIYLELERPKGVRVTTWKLVLDSCDAGNVLSNAASGVDADGDLVSVPTDKCDGVAKPTAADGCPTFSRQAKTSYKAKRDVLKGSLAVSAARADRVYNGLVGDVKVTVFKTGKGKKKVATFFTRPNGTFKLKLALDKGKYFAEFAPSIDPDIGRASKVKAKKFVVK
jgi:hypothetical protein